MAGREGLRVIGEQHEAHGEHRQHARTVSCLSHRAISTAPSHNVPPVQTPHGDVATTSEAASKWRAESMQRHA